MINLQTYRRNNKHTCTHALKGKIPYTNTQGKSDEGTTGHTLYKACREHTPSKHNTTHYTHTPTSPLYMTEYSM